MPTFSAFRHPASTSQSMKIHAYPLSRRAILALLGTLVLPASLSLAQTSGTWSSTTGGNWSDTNNWTSGIVATGGTTSANVTATFTTGSQTVNLDTAQTIDALSPGSAAGLVISSSNGSVLTLAGSSVPSINGTVTISASIAGTQGFSFSPGGTRSLFLSGNNTYTGVTTLSNGGQLYVQSSNALGATGTGNGTVVRQGTNGFPQIHFQNSVTTSEDITLQEAWTNVTNGTVIGGGSGGAGYLLYNDSGSTTLNGSLTLDRYTSTNGVNLVYAYGLQIAGTMTLNGNISGSASGGQASGTYVDPTRLQFKTTTATAAANVTGSISDGILTTGGLSVYTDTSNAGIVRLSGVNTYTGSTVHQKGTLLINNTTGSGTGMGAVSVASGATFGGTGIIKPAGVNGVTFASGAIVSPGDLDSSGAAIAAGKALTFDLSSTTGSVVFSGGSTIAINLNAVGSPVSESLAFVGLTSGLSQVTFNGNVVNFSIAGGVVSSGLYTLASFDANNAYTGSLVLGTGLEAYNAQLIQNANSIQLSISAIPEPASYTAMAGLAAIGAAMMIRKRRRS